MGVGSRIGWRIVGGKNEGFVGDEGVHLAFAVFDTGFVGSGPDEDEGDGDDCDGEVESGGGEVEAAVCGGGVFWHRGSGALGSGDPG